MRERLRSDERGFTLLELLVAVVILSILLAVSAQYYYHQRRKGWMAQVKSSVRNMATAENSHIYVGGFLAYSSDLDDLWEQGYRYQTDTVIPHVVLATSQNFCIQVNSAHDSSIVWHFSSDVGYPQEGPATTSSCGDVDGSGIYVAQGTGARDGYTSYGIQVASSDPGVPGSGASRAGDGEVPSTSTAGGTTTTTDPGGSTSGSTGGFGTADGTSGTTVTGGGGGGTATGGSSGTGGGGNGDGGGRSDETCKSKNDPDGDDNGGSDAPGGSGGIDKTDQDCNNGSGNDNDTEDDNNGGGEKN